VPTQFALDNVAAMHRGARHDDEKSWTSGEALLDFLREPNNKGDHGFDVDRLAENILEEGFNPLKEGEGWNRSGRPDPTFEFNRLGMSQFEGRHRLLALDKLGAPYVPYMGMQNTFVDEEMVDRGSAKEHPLPYGKEYEEMEWTNKPYSLGNYIGRGHIAVPPSYLYGRELVPGMGRLLPVNSQTGKPMDMLSHLDDGKWIDDDDTDIRAWKEKPSWEVTHDD
jgi:hypothetical protein